MHELSLCYALLEQVSSIAQSQGAQRVTRILLRIGPLAGVDPSLLRHAYPLAAVGSLAEGAELCIESSPLRIHCARCGTEAEVTPNRMLCPACGDFHTRLVSGDELLLAQVELVCLASEAESGVRAEDPGAGTC